MGLNTVGQSFSSLAKATAQQFTSVSQSEHAQFERAEAVHAPLLSRDYQMGDPAESMHLLHIEPRSAIAFNELCLWLTTGTTDPNAEIALDQQSLHANSFPERKGIYDRILKTPENKDSKGTNTVSLRSCSSEQLLKGLNELSQAMLNNEIKTGSTLENCLVNQDLNALRVLHSLKVNLRAADKTGYTPAATAAMHGYVDTLRVLQELGVDLSASNKDGWTPATLAANRGNAAALRTLQSLGVDLNASNRFGDTPATLAAYRGHLDALRAMHELNVDLSKPGGWTVGTPASEAAANGQTDTLRLLHKLNVHIDSASSVFSGSTPAVRAISKGHMDTLRVIRELDICRS